VANLAHHALWRGVRVSSSRNQVRKLHSRTFTGLTEAQPHLHTPPVASHNPAAQLAAICAATAPPAALLTPQGSVWSIDWIGPFFCRLNAKSAGTPMAGSTAAPTPDPPQPPRPTRERLP
jgi:hypothetical protein